MAVSVIAEKMSARRTRMDCTAALPLVAEPVAHSPHREDELRLLGVALELLAQVPDVHVDGARIAIGRVAPDPGQQLVAAEYPARVPGQRAQDLELHERQTHLVA